MKRKLHFSIERGVPFCGYSFGPASSTTDKRFFTCVNCRKRLNKQKGLVEKPRRWTEWEIEYVRKNYGKVPIEYIEKKLKRTGSSICTAIHNIRVGVVG